MQKALSDRGIQRFVGRVEVADALGVSTKTLDRMVADGKFPRSVRLSPNRVGWSVETVQAHLRSRIEGVTKLAVTDPDKLARDLIAPTMRELGARLVADHLGEPVSPDQIRLVVERQAPGSDVSLQRAELLQKLESLCDHFPYDRAVIIAASLFPAIREQLLKDFDLAWARDPDGLRHIAVQCLDDEAWAEFEEAVQKAGASQGS